MRWFLTENGAQQAHYATFDHPIAQRFSQAAMSLSDERRGFYRVEDEISLQIFAITAEEETSGLESLDHELPAEFKMLQELRQLENDNLQIFRSIQEKSHDVGHYFKVQNQKIDLLAQLLIRQSGDDSSLKTVNISGSGLSLYQQEPAELESCWQLKILVFPECFGFTCVAKVVSNEQDREGYQVAFEFSDIASNAQDELIRHITRLQSRQLRQQRLAE